MKMIRKIRLLFAFSSLFILTACAKEENLPPLPDDNNQEQPTPDNNNQEQQDPEDMTQEQQEIIASLDRWCRAMIDRDVETLGSLMADDLILVHITGATQTKQEWLDEIAAETMRYYHIERENQTIEVSGGRAIARYTSVIDARIWGSRGTWRLNTTMYMTKVGDNWIRTNPPQLDNR